MAAPSWKNALVPNPTVAPKATPAWSVVPAKPILSGAPKVETPETTSKPVANVATPTNVEIPETFRSLKLLGPTLIASSIVAVVTASSDAIPLKRNHLSITSVVPMESV